jgi:hypothetical protein
MAGRIAASLTVLSNAVKYNRGRERAAIDVDAMTIEGEAVIHVRDKGVRFDSR